MNYYSHHIGDFNNATRHLTRVERALYRDAIELYYDTESVLTKDFNKLARRLLVVLDEEKEMLKSILNEFFNETDDGFSHDRCDLEIAKYRTNTSNKAKAGIASALAKQQKSTRVQQNSTGVEQMSNEPITNNQEPITKKELIALACNSLKNEGITDFSSINPNFLKLIDLGVTADEFADCAKHSKVKKFNYIISVIAGRREDAKNLTIADKQPKKPNDGLNGMKVI